LIVTIISGEGRICWREASRGSFGWRAWRPVSAPRVGVAFEGQAVRVDLHIETELQRAPRSTPRPASRTCAPRAPGIRSTVRPSWGDVCPKPSLA